jgi:hypothetical protein
MASVIPQRYAFRKLAELVPHPDNPNRGEVADIAESIEAIGFFGVVVVQKSTQRILIGEHRWRAAQDAGLVELPVVETDCNDDVAMKIMLADNYFARLAVWDEDALIAVLTAMNEGGGTEGSGFTADDLAALVARQAEGLPEGFRHLTPRDPGYGEGGDRMVVCPNCGTEFQAGGR